MRLLDFACSRLKKHRIGRSVQEMQTYYTLFGFYGVFLAIKSCILRRPIQAQLSIPWSPHPLHLRLRTSDVLLFQNIFLNREYDYDYAVAPKVIVDAGANIGLASIFYSCKYPSSRIFAIEPEPSNFEILKANIASYPNISAVHAALWKEDCDVFIVDPGRGPWGFRTSAFRSELRRQGYKSIRGFSLDRFMRDYQIRYIDILKVDIEGAEKELFESAQEWIDRVGSIAIEIHDRFKPGCSEVVRAATRDFELVSQHGETAFLERSEIAAAGSEARRPKSFQSEYGNFKSTLPLKLKSLG